MLTRLTTLLRDLHDNLRRSEQVYMVIVSLVIGLLAGLCAVGFRLLIQSLNELAWGEGQYTLEYIDQLPFWWKLLVPATGGLIVGLIIHYFAREAKGHGVPEVMEAVALRGGRIRPRVVVAKMFASGLSIATGGSVGREGPIVQIGSALGSSIGQWLRVDERRLRTLVGCGAAAGIAGTFNAPVAGALFAVEIILGDFGVAQFSPIVIASVAGTVVSQHFLGDFPAFEVPPYELVHVYELGAYVVLGLLAAIVAVWFVRVLYATEDYFDAIKLYPPFKTAIGGFVIGCIGLFVPHIFGVGYEAINEALNGNLGWAFMLLLVLVKILAVSITIGSGGSGGVFAPSLFIGAMLGGGVGSIVHSVWPATTAGAGAYALVGMGAVVAAGTHAPITAILILFELTANYQIILPLMVSCIIATLLATRLKEESIYTLKLIRRGIDIHKGKALNVLRHVLVRDQMRTDVRTVNRGDGLIDVLSAFIDHPGVTLFVVDAERRLRGVITSAEVRGVMDDAATLETLVVAQDLIGATVVPSVSPDDSLADVMRHLGSYRGELPVVDEGRIVGVIWPEDVIERYNTEIFKRDMAQEMVAAVSHGRHAEPIPTVEDASVAEIPVPRDFIGRTIGALDIRQRFGVSVLVVKQSEPGVEGGRLDAAPDASYAFRDGDVLLVMGSNESIRAFEVVG